MQVISDGLGFWLGRTDFTILHVLEKLNAQYQQETPSPVQSS